jgi:hypothetical protein
MIIAMPCLYYIIGLLSYAYSSLITIIPHFYLSKANCLTSHEHTKSNNVRVDHAQVEWCEEWVRIGESHKSSVVHDLAVATSVHSGVGLVGVALVGTSDNQWGVGQVELVGPCNPLWCTSSSGSSVAVVGPNGLTWCVPKEANLLAWKRKRLRSVAGDGWATTVAGDVEVDARLIGWKGGDRRVRRAVASALPVGCVIRGEAVNVGLVLGKS